MKKWPLLVFTLFIVFYSCQNNSSEKAQPDFLAKNIDTTVNPAEDFFDYAVGNWAKNTPIPEEESGWGIGQYGSGRNLYTATED
jgi:putative endopeptidase